MAPSCCAVTMCESPDCLQLTDREERVCLTVCTSAEPVAFSTVKNEVGYHQEVLSRILRRLVTYRAIEKVGGKYRRASQ